MEVRLLNINVSRQAFSHHDHDNLIQRSTRRIRLFASEDTYVFSKTFGFNYDCFCVVPKDHYASIVFISKRTKL